MRYPAWKTSRAVLAAATLAGSACATNPVTGKRELALVSESQEIAMGKQGAIEVRQSTPLVADAELQQYVQSIGIRLAKASERPDLPWSFEVVDDPVINAFALPGGPIFVTRGILAYMQNEAELASVLGHEIGHITARHSVQQISRAQLATGLLGVGSILSSDVAAVAGIASQGLGLLFLKYGRDDETQADDLGFKYTLKDGYDVRAMGDMFEMLNRVSSAGGSQRLPEWLSTHPNPENRIAKTQERLATVTTDLSKAKRNHEGFVRHLDGMIYGENPRLGYFDGTRFNHPDLAFRMDFPSGWKTVNQAAAVIGITEKQDAIIALTIPGAGTLDQLMSQFLGQQGVQAGQRSSQSINGMDARTAEFQATTSQGQQVRGVVTFLAYGGRNYRLLGYAVAAAYPGYRSAILQSIQSFNKLTDPAALNKQPRRIELVKLSNDLTVTAFHQQYPSVVDVKTVAYLNGVNDPGATLSAGTWAKRVR